MNRVLYLKVSPRGAGSRTISIASVLIDRIKASYPDIVIDEVDLFTEKLPKLHADTVKGKYLLMGGNDIPPELRDIWREVEFQINRFLASDTIIIATPMWNFSVPYVLKKYMDLVFQPRYLYKYTSAGPVGLATGKRMFVVTSRGGDYTPGSPLAALDFQQPYIRAAFGFIGVTDITFVNAQPMDSQGPEVMHRKFEEAIAEIKKLQI